MADYDARHLQTGMHALWRHFSANCDLTITNEYGHKECAHGNEDLVIDVLLAVDRIPPLNADQAYEQPSAAAEQPPGDPVRLTDADVRAAYEMAEAAIVGALNDHPAISDAAMRDDGSLFVAVETSIGPAAYLFLPGAHGGLASDRQRQLVATHVDRLLRND